MELDVSGPELPHRSLLKAAGNKPVEAPGERTSPIHPVTPKSSTHHLSRQDWDAVRDAITGGQTQTRFTEQLAFQSLASDTPTIAPSPPDPPGIHVPIEQPEGVSVPKNPSQYTSWEFKGYRYLDNEPVFNGPPSPQQVKQGSIGDCFVIAPLAMAAHLRPDELASRVTQVNDITYDVRLGGPATGESVHRIRLTAPTSEAVDCRGSKPFFVGTHVHTNTGALWPVLFEKAYAAEMKHGYQDLDKGGISLGPIARFFDMEPHFAFISPKATGTPNALDSFSNENYEQFLAGRLQAGAPVVLSVYIPLRPEYKAPDVSGLSPDEAATTIQRAEASYTDELDHARKVRQIAQDHGLVANEDNRHAYWLYDYDPAQHAFKIANPHGFELMSDWIPVDKLRELNYRIVWGEDNKHGT
ncbi:MAG: hypothetical protein ACP5OR_06270 [Candidatus Dormibacteria bacterium]